MIPKECKRLAEVDFPIAEVSRQSAREKSIRHGHPSTLHLWWARRPLAACRSMLLALLLPDPCDEHCPKEFREQARELLSEPPMGNWKDPGETDKDLRESLLSFIARFSDWDVAADPTFLRVGRGLVKAAHPEETPLVVDPFAGGGSIPLEALRLGCDAFASDLNPVACLILKVMLEDIPRHGPKLAEELRRVGAEIKKQAEKELAQFYPKDPDGATPIAYLWARTVRCEAPKCGAEIPLMRSFWLCKKPNRKRALRPKVVKSKPPRVELEIFEPTTDRDVPSGTVSRAKAKCLNPDCGAVLAPDRVRAQLAGQRGGADTVFDAKGNRTGGARLLAVVTLNPGEQGRHYRLATGSDYAAVWKAQKRLKAILDEWERGGRKGLCPVPDEPTPTGGGSGAGRAFSFRRYGMTAFRNLFTARQNAALACIAVGIREAPLVDRYLCLALGKLVDLANSICRWEPKAECPRNVFGAGRVKPAWDFAEGVATGESSGSFNVCVDNMIGGIESLAGMDEAGTTQVAAAQDSPLPSDAGHVWFTDPPYYDAYPYADLSDVFFVWMRRSRPKLQLTTEPLEPNGSLTPKALEIIQDDAALVKGRPKDAAFFEESMATAFREGKRVVKASGLASVVFAHKTTEGWEALLGGMVAGGLTVNASWPVATEQRHRLRAKESAALETSVHLVCRPRRENAPVGDWAEVLRELPERVGDWMERLQAEGIRGADLVFACIGPALEIFSRFSTVETAGGREVKLAEYLEKVWEVVGRTALGQVLGTAEARARNSAAGAIEEDARLTALFLWTLQSTNGNSKSKAETDDEDDSDEELQEGEEEAARKKPKGYSLIFDIVRRFAQPLGIHLPDWEGRIIETKKGVVRLLSVNERAKQLFGREGAEAVAHRLEEAPPEQIQLQLFPDEQQAAAPKIKGRAKRRAKTGTDIAEGPSDEALESRREATTLDRIHAAMLLQAGGRTNALRALLKAEQSRSPDFLRLANALSALYPKNSEEKRLLDAMLLAVPR
jgi:putative DNA methylase